MCSGWSSRRPSGPPGPSAASSCRKLEDQRDLQRRQQQRQWSKDRERSDEEKGATLQGTIDRREQRNKDGVFGNKDHTFLVLEEMYSYYMVWVDIDCSMFTGVSK